MEERHVAPGDGGEQSGSSQPSFYNDSQLSAPLAQNSSTTLSQPSKKTHPTRATSATTSPFASRNSSPVRSSLKLHTSSGRSAGPGRSRNNSVQEVSPTRAVSNALLSINPPSSTVSQRTLSSGPVPLLQHIPTEITVKAPTPQKSNFSHEIKETPRWPISPRLRSPPPINKHSILSPRRGDFDPSVVGVLKSEGGTDEEPEESSATLGGMWAPIRGASGSTLETVQEISQPSTPGVGLDGIVEAPNLEPPVDTNLAIHTAPHKTVITKSAPAGAHESGSESGGKSEAKVRSASLAPVSSTRPSASAGKSYSASASVGRKKPANEGARSMTVETETVSSIPQVAVGGIGGTGSIRTKPSSETIRPRKDKKKTSRKAPSVNSGTASSKADIFEAKVASAVDEANSSDSEETFVYESNPPDNNDRPRRFHSRTPSVTSMASQVDQRNGLRTVTDTGHSVAMKKSMKFTNTYNTASTDPVTAEDDGKGTARSSAGTGRGTTHHHHIGRWGRNIGNGHASLFDNESPFPHAVKSKLSNPSHTSRNSSQPSSPKFVSRGAFQGKKTSPISSGYDMDDGADDERTPLVSTVRSGRSNRHRRPGSSLRQLEHQAARQNKSFMARFAGCIVVSLMILMVFVGAVGFMFATTQPLSEVKVLALKNVLASEQEIIFDIKVVARNPNIVVVTIDTADMVVFAKSKYAGTNSEWWKHPSELDQFKSNRVVAPYFRSLDVGPDPTTNPNLEIGQVFELRSPLIFDGSPFHHVHSTSMGQIRISHPGNKTVPAGSERWGRVVQHEFDLILRGTLRYTLPLTQKIRSVSVEGRVNVQPNAADQDPDALQPVSDGLVEGHVHIVDAPL